MFFFFLNLGAQIPPVISRGSSPMEVSTTLSQFDMSESQKATEENLGQGPVTAVPVLLSGTCYVRARQLLKTWLWRRSQGAFWA